MRPNSSADETGRPSTWVMMSPSVRPASAAGETSLTWYTKRPCTLGSIRCICRICGVSSWTWIPILPRESFEPAASRSASASLSAPLSARRDRRALLLAVAHVVEPDLAAGRLARDVSDQVPRVLDGHAVHADDGVAGLQPGLVGRLVGKTDSTNAPSRLFSLNAAARSLSTLRMLIPR